MLAETFQVKLNEEEFTLLKRLQKYSEGFERDFFTQMFYCIQADQYEWCCEFDLPHNLFYGQDDEWRQKYQKTFLKWVGAYYLLTFYSELGHQLEKKQWEAGFFLTLALSKKERMQFYRLKNLKEEKNPFFELESGKYLLKELFSEKNPTIQQLAITCHLLKNGYSIFITLFQRYYY
ncbi:MAG: hypothetical protein GX238_09370 [Epulopiscium sp.]|nr:hypothetical protein [Candidatus Epulonipiscium sp.]